MATHLSHLFLDSMEAVFRLPSFLMIPLQAQGKLLILCLCLNSQSCKGLRCRLTFSIFLTFAFA